MANAPLFNSNSTTVWWPPAQAKDRTVWSLLVVALLTSAPTEQNTIKHDLLNNYWNTTTSIYIHFSLNQGLAISDNDQKKTFICFQQWHHRALFWAGCFAWCNHTFEYGLLGHLLLTDQQKIRRTGSRRNSDAWLETTWSRLSKLLVNYSLYFNTKARAIKNLSQVLTRAYQKLDSTKMANACSFHQGSSTTFSFMILMQDHEHINTFC